MIDVKRISVKTCCNCDTVCMNKMGFNSYNQNIVHLNNVMMSTTGRQMGTKHILIMKLKKILSHQLSDEVTKLIKSLIVVSWEQILGWYILPSIKKSFKKILTPLIFTILLSRDGVAKINRSIQTIPLISSRLAFQGLNSNH